MRIFAVAFNSQESSKQEKHCDIVLTCKFGKILFRRTEHNCFRLYVYAIYSAYLQAWDMFHNPVPDKVFADTYK